MQIPPVTELEEAAKKIVWAAKKKGTLKELTPRLIRQMIEKQLGLEEASLDASEYKSAIKDATTSALNDDPPSEEEEALKSPAKKPNKKRRSDTKQEEDDQPTPKRKGKESAIASKDKEDDGGVKKKRKTVKAKNVESEDDKEENSDSEEASPTMTKKKKSKRKDTKQFKSLEHVPTSDMEQDEPGSVNIAGPSVTKADSAKEKKESSLKTKTVPSKLFKEPQNSESKPTDGQQSEVPDVVMKDDAGRDVSSELSESDEPKPKQKAKAVNKEPKTTKTKEKEKKGAKSSTTSTKDEETVKRLKSLVLACGVRKVWSKVLQDLDSPNQQIKKLKEILAELGMTGRMSMDQAKTIKQKRELAKELEDVQQFEKNVLGRSSRSRSQTTKVTAVEEDDSEKDEGPDSGDEENDEAPKRRPTNARKSIMAFLQDQSDEE